MRNILLVIAIILLCICIFLQVRNVQAIKLVHSEVNGIRHELRNITTMLEDVYAIDVEYYED